ncbi:hypothetical protein CBL_20237, partial [Carabus blaptoides fortunei]
CTPSASTSTAGRGHPSTLSALTTASSFLSSFAPMQLFGSLNMKNSKNMINILRPGYKPPNRNQIANELLDQVHCSVKQTTEKNLKVKLVCMTMDGWMKSFVTDNASNMVKMRGKLAECDDMSMPDIIAYASSALILNLLAKDIDVPGLKD